jgi:hypothetical protein
MQWQAWIWSCSVNGSFSACQFAFDWDNDGFACSSSMGISNLSLSQSHEYHHPDSLQLTNGKDGSKQHFLGSIGGLLSCGSNAVCLGRRDDVQTSSPMSQFQNGQRTDVDKAPHIHRSTAHQRKSQAKQVHAQKLQQTLCDNQKM